MTGKYELKRTSDAQLMFNLIAGNGEVILTSERYTTKASAGNGVESVRTNSPLEERFERRDSTADQPYFVLKAANHEIIGKSQMYSSASARDKGIESVRSHGPDAELEDR